MTAATATPARDWKRACRGATAIRIGECAWSTICTPCRGEPATTRKWGARGLLRLAAGADGQGLSFSLRPGWGSEIGDPQRMWEQGLRGALASDTAANPSARLEMRMGYGVSSRAGLLTPWGGVALNGDDKRYRLGLDWSPGGSFSLRLSGERHETTNAEASHAVMLKGDVRF